MDKPPSLEERIKTMPDDEVEERLQEWGRTHNDDQRRRAAERLTDALYDRFLCKQIGVNYADPSNAECKKILLYLVEGNNG